VSSTRGGGATQQHTTAAAQRVLHRAVDAAGHLERVAVVQDVGEEQQNPPLVDVEHFQQPSMSSASSSSWRSVKQNMTQTADTAVL